MFYIDWTIQTSKLNLERVQNSFGQAMKLKDSMLLSANPYKTNKGPVYMEGGPQMGEVTSGGSLICRAGYLTYLMQFPPPPSPLYKQALMHQTLIRVKQMGLLIRKDKVEKERRE